MSEQPICKYCDKGPPVVDNLRAELKTAPDEDVGEWGDPWITWYKPMETKP